MKTNTALLLCFGWQTNIIVVKKKVHIRVINVIWPPNPDLRKKQAQFLGISSLWG